MLNSADEHQAESSSNYWLKQNPIQARKLRALGVTRAKPFIDKFTERHQPIAHYFCKGKQTGLKIMNRDSRIALEVVNHFGKKGIPILSIHDSFIVQKQYRDELYDVMITTYHKVTGFEITVK